MAAHVRPRPCCCRTASEGQGPEHSSARLERYPAALRRTQHDRLQPLHPGPTTSTRLRRQLKRNFRKPLILMTPKSLLRHKLAVSSLDEFNATSGFKFVIPEIDDAGSTRKRDQARRALLRQGLLRPAGRTARARHQGCRHRAAGTILPLPGKKNLKSAIEVYPERRRSSGARKSRKTRRRLELRGPPDRGCAHRHRRCCQTPAFRRPPPGRQPGNRPG